jgi:very-short-patch-repair endonuclease
MTPAERVLWEALRDRRLGGLKFRCQHPIGPFVLDFYCPERRLVVEVDGGIHNEPDQAAYDAARTEHLRAFGLAVVRVRNDEVYDDLPAALARIVAAAELVASPDAPVPGRKSRSPRPPQT